MNKEIIKAKAKALRAFLETQGLKLNHSGALEAIARIEGEASYNVLQSKFKGVPFDVAAPVTATFDDFVGGDIDVHAGLLPAYRYGNLEVALTYSRSLSWGSLQLEVYKVHENGDATGDKERWTCQPLGFESNLVERRNFVQKVARLLGPYLTDAIGVRALGREISVLTEQAVPDWSAMVKRLSEIVADEHLLPSWEIEVCRIGYGHTTVDVENMRSRKEAEALALENACNYDYSENSSDYVIAGKAHAEESSTQEDDNEVLGEPRSWTVDVCRISYGTLTLQIQAATQEKAESKALDEAGNHYFSEQDAKYEIGASYCST